MSSPHNDRWQTLEEYIDGCEDINMSFSNVNLQSLEEDPDDFEGIDVSFSDEQWQTLGEGNSNDLYIEHNVINDDPLTIVVDQGQVEQKENTLQMNALESDDKRIMMSTSRSKIISTDWQKVIVRDYANETIEEQLKWIDDANAKASTTDEKALPKATTSQEKVDPSASSSSAAMSTASASTGFEKPVAKGKKHPGKSNEKDSKGTKMKKWGGKKKNHK